jgi:lipopolysaccharide transport system ATP-binding protein
MAEDVVIRTEGLGKKYLIGHQAERERYVALRDVLARGARDFWRKTVGTARGRAIIAGDTVEEFWALKDVSFEVRRGEVLGIIGRNGAGKSTLLKILSRITEPSTGRVVIKGRVASLLEVGTGFHPELTGRENIYLNGAILGMTHAEIRRKFDEIVAFAEVESFLDTPVKRYSSGMYVRLAFAVAAHLEPEILIVDEVLAVGDAEFQKKCLGKMGEVSRREGRTVLFVSHNLPSVEVLCTRCVLISSGRLSCEGSPSTVIHQYLAASRVKTEGDTLLFPLRRQLTRPYLLSVEILDESGNPKTIIQTWDYVVFRVRYYSPVAIDRGSVVISLSTIDGRSVGLLSTRPDQEFEVQFQEGENVIDCIIPKLPLSAGDYQFGAALAIPNVEWLDKQLESHVITVHPKNVYNASLAPTLARGILALDYSWCIPERQTGTRSEPLVQIGATKTSRVPY